MNKWMVVLLIVFLLLFAGLLIKVFAGRGFDPEYQANRALHTALLGEIFTGDDEADQVEIDRLMDLPKYVMAFPTGELAKSNWLFVDESLEYAI